MSHKVEQNRYFFIGLIAGIVVLAGYMQSTLLLNWDVSWLMHASRRLLAGGTYLHDFFEINPPLILYIYSVPVQLKKIFDMNIVSALRIFIYLVAAFSWGVCYLLANVLFSKQKPVFFLFLLFLLVIYLIVPVYEFGQREHILLMFVMPYLLLCAYRLQGGTVHSYFALGIGWMAGMGFALKPFFLIPFVMVETYYIFCKKNYFSWMRAETLTLIFFLILYSVCVFIFYPDYLFRVIPFVTHFYYLPMQAGWNQLVFWHPALLCYLVILFYFIQYDKKSNEAVSTVLIIALGGFLCSYFLQGTLWYYHVLPAYSLAILLLGLFLTQFIVRVEKNTYDYLLLGFLGIIAVYFMVAQSHAIWTTLIFSPSLFFIFFISLFFSVAYLTFEKKSMLNCIIAFTIITAAGLTFFSVARLVLSGVAQFTMTVIFLFLLFGWMAKEIKTLFIVVLSAVLLAFPVYFINQVYLLSLIRKDNMQALIAFTRQYAYHQPVYFLSNFSASTFPTVDYADAIPITRTAFLGWIPGVIKKARAHQSDATLQKELNHDKTWMIDMISEDITTKKPSFIFVDISKMKPYLDIPLDLLQYFSQNAHFLAAWKNYHYFTTIGQSGGSYTYAVYRRQ